MAALFWPLGCVLIDDDPPGGPDDVDWPPGDEPGPDDPVEPSDLRHTPYTHLAEIKDWSELDRLGTDVDAEALVSWAAGTNDVLAWRVLRRVGTEPWRFEFDEGGSPELLVPGIVRAFELEFGEEAPRVRLGTRIVAPTYTNLFVISYVAKEAILADDGVRSPEWPPLDPPPPDDPIWDEEDELVGKIDAELLELLELEPELELVDVAIRVEGVHELELNAEAAQRFAFHNEAGATLMELRREILDAHQQATFEFLSGPSAELQAMIEPSVGVGVTVEIHRDVLVGALDATVPVSLLHDIADLPWVSAIWGDAPLEPSSAEGTDWDLPPLTTGNAAFGRSSDRDLVGIPQEGRVATFRRIGIETFHLAGLSGNSHGLSRFSPMRVGTLDLGIAPLHPAWQDRRGQTRVTDLWDCGRFASCDRCSTTRMSICGSSARNEHGMDVAGLLGAGIPSPATAFRYDRECVPSGQFVLQVFACCSMDRDPDNGLCVGSHLSEREHRLARIGVVPDAELLHASASSQRARTSGFSRMINHDAMAVGTSMQTPRRGLQRDYACPATRRLHSRHMLNELERGINAGVPFFAAAGNDGEEGGNSQGCTILRPAAFWHAFAIANAWHDNDTGERLLAPNSSVGPRGAYSPTLIELAAPGRHGLTPQTSPPVVHPLPPDYRGYQGSGTSLAQPIATGTYLLLREMLRAVGSPMEGEVGAILTYLHATAEPFISQEEPYPYNEEEGAGLILAVLPDPVFGNLTPPFDIHMSSHRLTLGERVEVVANPDAEGKGMAMPVSRLYNRSVHTFWHQNSGVGAFEEGSDSRSWYHFPRVDMAVDLLARGESAGTDAEGHGSCPASDGSKRFRAPATRDSTQWRLDSKGRVRLGEQNTRGTCQVASFRAQALTTVYYTRIFTSEPEDGELDPAWVRFVNLMPPENPPVRVEVVQETEDGRWTSLRTRDEEPIESGMLSNRLPIRASMGPTHFRADWSGEHEAVTTRIGLNPAQEYTAYIVPDCGGHDSRYRWRGRVHVVEEDQGELEKAWRLVRECSRSPNSCKEHGRFRFLNAIPFNLRAGVLELRLDDQGHEPRLLSTVLDPAGTLMPGSAHVVSAFVERKPERRFQRWVSTATELYRVAMMREAEQAYVRQHCVINTGCRGEGPPVRMDCGGVRCNHDPDPLAEILGAELLAPEVVRQACTISPTIVRGPPRPSPRPPLISPLPPGGVTGPLPDLPEPIIFPPSLPPLSPFPPLNAPGLVSPIQAMGRFVNNPCTTDYEAELDFWNRQIQLRVTCAWPERPELP